MLVTIKRTMLIVVLFASLLAAMVGGIIRTETTGSGNHLLNTHPIAYNCPAPPVEC